MVNSFKVFMLFRDAELNCGHGDFQPEKGKFGKSNNFNMLKSLTFFSVILVLFGNFSNFLSLTGTIWAQFLAGETRGVSLLMPA